MCISAILGIGSALIGAGSASKAANAQKDASQQQIDLQREIYGDQKELFAPFLGAGQNALGAYNYELGLGEAPENYGGFTATPGYDYRLQQGVDAVQSGVGARHGLNSGATLESLTTLGQNLGTQEYGNYMNRLAGLTDMGQASAGMTATAGSNFAAGASNALGNYGNAAAAGAVGVGNALQSGIGNVAGAWQYGQGLNSASPQYTGNRNAGQGVW